MIFEKLEIEGALLIRPEPFEDHRGIFARAYCRNEFEAAGLAPDVVQASTSYNRRAGTVRGMHFQWHPSVEAKTVRCIRGLLFDVLLDLRPDSPSYLRHQSVTISQDDRLAVFIPPGIAHGFQTLANDTEVLYLMSDYYAPDLAHGFRWNDSAFDIAWPLTDIAISGRDATYADFDQTAFESEIRRRQSNTTL
jgi:dTDP-4-dehydrorhamnose 3,5-epimerase